MQVPPCKAPYKRTQHCWMLHVASVWKSCCISLHVVGSCCIRLHTAANMEATTPNIVGQQCWGLLRPFVGSLRESEKALLVESRLLGFGLKKSGIPLMIGIRNPSSTDEDPGSTTWNPKSTAWDPESKSDLDSLTPGDTRVSYNLSDPHYQWPNRIP